mgnify:CR=1 FL=1
MASVQQVNSVIAAVIASVVAHSSADFTYRGYLSQVKQQISDMAVNGSGIRDPVRVLKVSPTTGTRRVKKKNKILSQ